MFNLEEKISEWRRQMLAAGIQSPVPLEELENHLRDELEQQIKIGLTAQTAFPIAVEKIGHGNALQDDFKKVRPSNKTRNWKFFEGYFLVSTLLIPPIVGGQAFVFKSEVFSEMTVGQQSSILAASLVFSLLAGAMRFCHAKFAVLRTSKLRDFILVPVVSWVLLAACFIIPHFNFTDVEKALVSMWAFAPFGILIGWAWGFASDGRKRATGENISACQR